MTVLKFDTNLIFLLFNVIVYILLFNINSHSHSLHNIKIYYYAVSVTRVNTFVLLCRTQHPEDGRMTDRKMLVRILQIKIRHKIIAHLLVVDTFYVST